MTTSTEDTELKDKAAPGDTAHATPDKKAVQAPPPVFKRQARPSQDWSTLSLDFVKFLVSALGFGVILLGYSYSHTFFRSFGISLFQLDMSPIDITYRGVALIDTPKVVIAFSAMIIVSAVLLALRSHMKQVFGLVAAGFAVIMLISGTLTLGRATGQDHAKSIWAGDAGKKVFCRFQAKATDPLSELLPALDALAGQERLKLIFLGEDTIYLAPKLTEIPVGRTTGESFAIPTSALRFCRIVGT